LSQTITRLHQNGRTYDLIYCKCTKLKFIYHVNGDVTHRNFLSNFSTPRLGEGVVVCRNLCHQVANIQLLICLFRHFFCRTHRLGTVEAWREFQAYSSRVWLRVSSYSKFLWIQFFWRNLSADFGHYIYALKCRPDPDHNPNSNPNRIPNGTKLHRVQSPLTWRKSRNSKLNLKLDTRCFWTLA